MSENERIPAAQDGGDSGASMTAGQMLRAAREHSGMQLTALASAIKVSAQKLEALETDQLDQLPDATFARALAKTVCRFLKIDAEPVLARLPHVKLSELEHVAQGLNQPFRDVSHRQDIFHAETLKRPAVLGSLLLVGAALLLWLLPSDWLRFSSSEGEASPSTVSVEPAASDLPPAVPETQPSPSVPVPAVPAPQAVPPAATQSPAVSAADAVVVRAQASSWVAVQDADGRTLLSRQLAAGETATLQGRFPMRVEIGNVGGTELTARGQAVDLRPHARGNVARFELQ